MKPLFFRPALLVGALFVGGLLLTAGSPVWAQNTWVEPTLAPVPASIADYPSREGLKGLYPPNIVKGTLVSLSHNILSLRPLPASASNTMNGTLTGHFVPLNLGAGERAYGPRILPDGSAVVFRVAGADGNFHLYKYTLADRKLSRLTATPLTFDRIEFSPMGQQAAILRGVDATGAATAAGSGQLMLLDMATGKETPLAKTDAAGFGGWAFLNPTTLVYTAMPTGQAFPALYSVATKGATAPKLLAKMAWRPIPAPDGNRLAFFGAEKPDATEDDALRLSARWDQNPRGAFVSVMNGDGSNRQALWRQDGAYPLLQWSGDTLLTLKNHRWVADMGEHRIDRYDATRLDDYKGGLFGTLSLEGNWKWIALVKQGSIADYQVYQVYPTTNVDYDFAGLGAAGDGQADYFTTRTTTHSAQGDKASDALWIRKGAREFQTIGEFEGSDGIDFHDESGANARPTNIGAIIAANPQGEAIAAAAYQAQQANQKVNVAASVAALKAILPDANTAHQAAYKYIEGKIGEPVATPPIPADPWAWEKARTAELFPQTDKALRTKNSFIRLGEALHIAEQMLASTDAKTRQTGFDFASDIARRSISVTDKELMGSVLLGWLYPNIEMSQANAQMVPILNNLGQGVSMDPAIKIAALRLQADADFGISVENTRLRLAAALAEAKRFAEAEAVLNQITEPEVADKVAQQKEKLAALKAAG